MMHLSPQHLRAGLIKWRRFATRSAEPDWLGRWPVGQFAGYSKLVFGAESLI
jgi:hypothetical protein